MAILLGFEDNHAMIWHVFSRVVKPFKKIQIDGRRNDDKNLYNFHESIIDTIKPTLKEGVHSVVLVSAPRTTYSEDFLKHVNKHHKYLTNSKGPNQANFGTLVGSAVDKLSVSELVKTKTFIELIEQTTSEDADRAVSLLEKYLYDTEHGLVLYSLKEIEKKVFQTEPTTGSATEYLLLTNNYLKEFKQKSRIHRLLQISKNKKIKTKVIDGETAAGSRINQFGGIVFFAIICRQNSG